MQESVKNDYTKVLPMFAFCENSGAQVSSSDMNRAIRKGRKLIEKHSITAKPKRSPGGAAEEYRNFYNQREFNRWVDDAWMLIGKSHIYSRNWYEAIAAFNEVIQLFPKKSVRYEAILWIARAYIEMEDLENARISLQQYSSEVKDEDQFYAVATSTYAWYWLVQEDYEKALDFCLEAADNAGNRWQKVRWYFVLGQVAEKAGRDDLAYEAYRKVESMNPDYEMVIHARVRNALIKGGPDNPEQSRQDLNKYAGEYKNLDYRDQIYFGIAQTWFWQEDTLNALVNLQLAAGYGGNNQILAGNIYKRMAEIYFQSGDYIAADAYYDSTLTALPQDYKGISEIRQLEAKLNPLADNLRTIQYEDSVQQIAGLPEVEREHFIDNLLVQMQEKAEQASFSNQTDDAFFYRNFANRGNRSTDESGKWYFYNQTMVSLGQMEFEKRWGRRKLEDNWRRGNKESQASQQEMGETDGMMPDDPFSQEPPGPGNESQTQSQEEDGKPDRESLLSGLPLTLEDMETSHMKIQRSLYNAGHLLAQNFDQHTEAVSKFEELLSEYPKTNLREQALMGIYLSCSEIQDRNCLEYYGKVIVDDYPQSQFTAFIEDPEFFARQKAREQEMEKLYDQAYRDFKNGLWNKAREKTSEIIDSNSERLMPQALLLNSAAYSQTGNNTAFQNGLETLIDDYPRSKQAELARHWLTMLEEGHEPQQNFLAGADVKQAEQQDEMEKEPYLREEKERFVYQPESEHHVIIALQPEAEINQILFYLANFNFDRYTIGGLQLETKNIGSIYNVIQTGPFENSEIGLDYFFSLVDNPSVFAVENPGVPLLLLISEENLEQLDSGLAIEEYKNFFLENYLPGSAPSAIVISENEVPDIPYTETSGK